VSARVITIEQARALMTRRWAVKIRADMKWAGCGQPDHRIDTPFRRASKWPPVDECVLRDLARRQAAESRRTP
jgi:hypothetical protein